MPAWPGGPCPECGDDTPANVIHCRSCRALLNRDLKSDSVEIPVFIPLQELDSMSRTAPAGYYVGCPACDQELRIAAKYVGKRVACKHCKKPFELTLDGSAVTQTAFYCDCPHCEKGLRAAPRYMGQKVACKHCGGKIHFVEKVEA